eukprot:3581013-Pyramimonas_sp.AAC.1
MPTDKTCRPTARSQIARLSTSNGSCASDAASCCLMAATSARTAACSAASSSCRWRIACTSRACASRR